MLRQEREKLQVTNDITVVRIDPILVEAIDTGATGIEPDSAGDGLSELGAVGIHDERQGQAIDGASELPAGEVDAGGNIAPLIAAANLELAVVVAAEHVEVEGLEQHVAELGEADAGLAVLHARAHAFLRHHLVDGEMLADVAQEFEKTNGGRPALVIQEAGGIGGDVEIEEAAELLLYLGDVGVEDILGEQLALLRAAAGVADGAGGPAGERDGVMAQQLKPAQGQQRHQAANVQAVGGRVKAAV